MKNKEIEKIKEFLENYDLGWKEEVYTIAKKTIKDIEQKNEM